MRHTIKRTFLVKRVQTWDVDLPDTENPQHFIDDHFHQFDSDLTSGMGTLTSETTELLDYDELHLEVLERESGKVIPIGRKRDA